jgi:Ca2+-dependent lipid-binding protein
MPASPNSGSLRVRLSHAIGLRSMDSNGYSGPYVKLTLGKETHKSEIVKESLNPRWDKDYFFRGGFEQLVALPLQVHAWDYDRLSIRNDPLGNGSIDLRQLDLGSCQAVDCSVQLKDEQVTPGEVFFTIQWQPDAGAALRLYARAALGARRAWRAQLGADVALFGARGDVEGEALTQRPALGSAGGQTKGEIVIKASGEIKA